MVATVSEIMAPTPITARPETTMQEVQAAELMRNAAVRRLPVVRDGKALGVVSLGDIAALGSPDSVLGGISMAIPNT